MLKRLSRLLDLLLAFCFSVISSPRKWTRYAPVLFTTGIVLFLYSSTGRIDTVDLNVMILFNTYPRRNFQISHSGRLKMISCTSRPLKTPSSINWSHSKPELLSTSVWSFFLSAKTLTPPPSNTFLHAFNDANWLQLFVIASAKDTITWILIYSSAPVHFHILSDTGSTDVIDTIMTRSERQANCRFTYSVETIDSVYDQLVEILEANVPHLKLDMVKEHVSTQMLPLILQWHYPHLNRLIFVSNHIKFRADIVQLYEYFERFESQQMMGLTLAQDAKFATSFAVHRHLQPDSKLGLSPPQGWPGFNTELILLDLDKMRQSNLLKRYLDLENQLPIMTKYDFSSRQVLPQLDEWLTLVGIEKPQLFFELPCQWNVQQIMDSDAFEYCRIDIKAMAN